MEKSELFVGDVTALGGDDEVGGGMGKARRPNGQGGNGGNVLENGEGLEPVVWCGQMCPGMCLRRN